MRDFRAGSRRDTRWLVSAPRIRHMLAIARMAILAGGVCNCHYSLYGLREFLVDPWAGGYKTLVRPPPKAPSLHSAQQPSVFSPQHHYIDLDPQPSKKGESPAPCIPRPHSDSPDIPLRHIDNEALLSPHPPQRPLSGRLPSLPGRGGGGGGDRHRRARAPQPRARRRRRHASEARVQVQRLRVQEGHAPGSILLGLLCRH